MNTASAVARIQKQHPHLQSKAFREYLDGPFFVLGDVAHSRRDIVDLTGTPCIRAALALERACRNYRIHSLAQLFIVGLYGLTRCAHIGERAAYVAACLLYHHGYDLDKWTTRTGSTKQAIRLVYAKTQKQKH